MTEPGPCAYAARLRELLPDLLDAIERLVTIESGSYDVVGVNAVVDELGEALAAVGFRVDRAPLDARGDRLTATLEVGVGPRVLVLGHADTLWPAGTLARWPYARKGDRLTGPGVGDMKSSLPMAVYALRAVHEERGLGGLGSIRFLLVPDEELGSAGSRPWIEAEARDADVCLTLEAARPGGGVVVARGAVGAVYVRARGVEEHVTELSGDPASAVSALAALVPQLEGLTDRAHGVSVLAGVLRGGTARQIVPGEAELHLDLRAADAASAGRLVDDVRAVVGHAVRVPGVSIVVEGGITRPAFETSRGTRSLYACVEALARALEIPVHSVVEAGGSDASFAAALGVPTIDGLGPVCHQSCSPGEWVEVTSIVERGAVFAGLVAAIADGRALAGP